MDDIGPAQNASRIEVSINTSLKLRESVATIATNFVKTWETLSIPEKNTLVRFCIKFGQVKAVVPSLVTDLIKRRPFPWASIFEVFFGQGDVLDNPFNMAIQEALLAGATHDNVLFELGAAARLYGAQDPRWQTLFDDEFLKRITAAKAERERLFKDVQVFKARRMDVELAQALTRILTLFPGDREAQTLLAQLKDLEVIKKIDEYKNKYLERKPALLLAEKVEWPELKDILKKLKPTLNFEQGYLVSISLFQMEFYGEALDVLRYSKKRWTAREKLWEIELLLCNNRFAEALSSAQIIFSDKNSDPDAIRSSLYFSAKAYYGLGDVEQAKGVLQGILKIDPLYRDASILIREWTT